MSSILHWTGCEESPNGRTSHAELLWMSKEPGRDETNRHGVTASRGVVWTGKETLTKTIGHPTLWVVWYGSSYLVRESYQCRGRCVK
jgi:hypothetical protein